MGQGALHIARANSDALAPHGRDYRLGVCKKLVKADLYHTRLYINCQSGVLAFIRSEP